MVYPPAELATAPEYLYHLPHAANRNFAGRDRVIRSIGASFRSDRPHERAQVICGPGGVGKTQVALEYARRHRNEYVIVWWLAADEPVALEAGIAALAGRLGLVAADALPDEAREALKQHLAERSDWLLVFDAADEPAALAPYLPPPTGNVLVTSRSGAWDGIAASFQLRVLERDESVAMLRRRSGRPDESDAAAATLARALGDQPMALELAAVTVREADISFAEYIGRFEDHWAELLRSGRRGGDYPDTVAMAWALASRAMEDAAQDAGVLLKVCAFFAPADVPRWMLLEGAAAAPVPLSNFREPAELERALTTLERFGLAAVDERSVRLGRVAAELVRDDLPQAWLGNWCDAAVRFAWAAFGGDVADRSHWPRYGEVLPHALAAAGHAEAAGVAAEVCGRLLNAAGQYLCERGRYDPARRVLERALVLTTQAHGAHNPRRSAVVANLARALRRLGQAEQAKAHLQAAVEADRSAYGDDHRHVVQLVNNVGTCLYETGDLSAAREHFAWALDVCRGGYGEGHGNIGPITNNLAGEGDVDNAVGHFTRALSAAQASLGDDHPVVAHIAANLGITLGIRGDRDAGAQYVQWAIDVAERTLGPDHADLARLLGYLGLLEMDRGNPASARRHLGRALAIEERTLGRDHVGRIARLNHLARCLKALGDVDGAVACHDRCAAIVRRLRENENETAEADPGNAA